MRDRVGVPRDLPLPAARQLRAHLNWAIDALRPGV
jgi:glutathione S-transferase